MTNPRLETQTKEKSDEYANRPILTVEEVDDMILKADRISPTPYFRLRAKCLISLFHKFGKRRIEVGGLRRTDFKQVNGDLEVKFVLAKKKKKGLIQYLNFLEKNSPDLLSKPMAELRSMWRGWQDSELGHKTKNTTSLHSISLSDKYSGYVTAYLDYLSVHHPDAKFLFPSGTSVFGESYVVFPEQHLSGRQLLRIVKDLNRQAWCHLFRDTKGGEIAKAHGRTLDSVYHVKETLDLAKEETAYHYIARFVAKREPVET
jgi:integrase